MQAEITAGEDAWCLLRGPRYTFGDAATGERTLVEASSMDRIWGIGFAADAEEAHDPKRWNGLNLLGEVLMEVRDHVAAGGL